MKAMVLGIWGMLLGHMAWAGGPVGVACMQSGKQASHCSCAQAVAEDMLDAPMQELVALFMAEKTVPDDVLDAADIKLADFLTEAEAWGARVAQTCPPEQPQ